MIFMLLLGFNRHNKLHIFNTYDLISFDVMYISVVQSHTHTIQINLFVTPQSILVTFNPFFLPFCPNRRQPPIYFQSLQISLHFLEYYVNDSTQFVTFYCLASLIQHHHFEIHLCCCVYQQFYNKDLTSKCLVWCNYTSKQNRYNQSKVLIDF